MERKTPVDESGHGGPRIKLSLRDRKPFHSQREGEQF